MAILKGYEAIIEGKVFSSNIFEFSPEGTAHLRSVVALLKYHVPSGLEVFERVKSLVQKAEDIPEEERLKNFFRDNETLEDLVFSLPTPVLKVLNHKDTREQIADSYTMTRKERFLTIDFGIIPNVLIETGALAGAQDDPSWYGRMLSEESLASRNLGRQWILTLPVNPDDKAFMYGYLLPNINVVKYLISNPKHLRETPILEISGKGFYRRNAFAFMDRVYDYINPRTYAAAHDITDMYMDNIAAMIVGNICQRVTEKLGYRTDYCEN